MTLASGDGGEVRQRLSDVHLLAHGHDVDRLDPVARREGVGGRIADLPPRDKLLMVPVGTSQRHVLRLRGAGGGVKDVAKRVTPTCVQTAFRLFARSLPVTALQPPKT